MAVSHPSTDLTNGGDPILRILSELEVLLRRVAQQGSEERNFEHVDGELHRCFVAAEREVLAHELARLDVDRPALSIGGRCYRRVLRAAETYTSAVGAITVMRTLYRAGSEPAAAPLELRAGIIAGPTGHHGRRTRRASWSPT